MHYSSTSDVDVVHQFNTLCFNIIIVYSLSTTEQDHLVQSNRISALTS